MRKSRSERSRERITKFVARQQEVVPTLELRVREVGRQTHFSVASVIPMFSDEGQVAWDSGWCLHPFELEVKVLDFVAGVRQGRGF